MATEEQELRLKFSGDSSGYEAAVNRASRANENLLQSGGKLRKGLIAFGSELTSIKGGYDLLGDSITTATRVFKVGIGAMVGAGIGNALASQIKEAAAEMNKLSEAMEKVSAFDERNEFKSVSQLSKEIKEAESNIKDLQDKINPKLTDVKAQMERAIIMHQTGMAPGDIDHMYEGMQKNISDFIIKPRQEAGVGIEQRKLELLKLQIEGRHEEAEIIKRNRENSEAIHTAGIVGGQRAQDIAKQSAKIQGDIIDRQESIAKQGLGSKIQTGFGRHEEAMAMSREMSLVSDQIRDIQKFRKPGEEPGIEELKLQEKYHSLDQGLSKFNAQTDVESEKFKLAEKTLAIESQNVSKEEKKRSLLQSEIESLREIAKIEESTDSEKARNDRLSAQEKQNQLRMDNQELNFGKSALDIQRRIHQEQREQKRRDNFDKRVEASQGLLPFGLHRDISGNIISGRDPINGNRIEGKPEKTLEERVTPHILSDRANGDKAFHDLFNRKMSDKHKDDEKHRIAAVHNQPKLDPVVKAIQDQTNAWLAALLK